MLWIWFSILPAILWAILNIADKYVLTKWIKNPMVILIFTGITGLIIGLIIMLFKGFVPLSSFHLFLIIIIGAISFFSTILFLYAVKYGDISRVIPIFYTAPIFVLILATIFLGEIFTPIKYFGIAFVISGAIIISINQSFRLRLDKAFWFMLSSSLCSAISMVILKYLLNYNDFWSVFSYIRFVVMLFVIPVIFKYLPALKSAVNTHGKKIIVVMAANSSVNAIAALMITIATAVGFVTLTQVLSSIHPFFVLLFTIIVSTFMPKILKEKFTRNTIIMKATAVVLMFVGAILIT